MLSWNKEAGPKTRSTSAYLKDPQLFCPAAVLALSGLRDSILKRKKHLPPDQKFRTFYGCHELGSILEDLLPDIELLEQPGRLEEYSFDHFITGMVTFYRYCVMHPWIVGAC